MRRRSTQPMKHDQAKAKDGRNRKEESVKYPVTPATRAVENSRYPATPVTVATPIIPLPEVPVHHPKRDDDRPHFRNRMILCLLAVAFNWGTTLRIANHFASRVILVPSLDFVSKTCKSAYNITRDERLRYSKCVESQLNQCNRKLDRTIKKEDERVRKLSKQNEDVVRRIEEIATNCSKSYTTLRLTLEDWMANGGNIPTRSSSISTSLATDSIICSPEDQQTFNQALLGTQNTIALQTEALRMANAYSDESTSTVKLLAETVIDLDSEISALDDYIVQRAKYDVNYIDEKTQYIQDALYDIVLSMDPANVLPLDITDLFDELVSAAVDLKACVSLDVDARMADGSKCQPNLATMVDEFVDDAKWKVKVLNETLYEYRETLLEYRDRMEEYKENVMTAYNVAKRFYDGAKAFINAARTIVFWENVGDWFDISDRDFLPVDVNFPDVDIAIADVGAFDSINAMWAKVAPKFDAFITSISRIPPTIKDRFEELIDDVMMKHSVALFNLIPNLLPDDYNPPKYIGTVALELNPKEEVSSYKNKSEVSGSLLLVLTNEELK